MRKYLIVCILLLFSAPASAVLKEKDLARTLGVLRLELERNYKQQKNFIARYELMSKNQHQQLVNYMKKSEQISLMLYSQKTDFTFDVAYACQQATDLYRSLHKTNIPYNQACQRILAEISRYDSLIISLKALPPAVDGVKSKRPDLPKALADSLLNDSLPENDNAFTLDEAEQKDRERCLLYAKALRNNLARFLISLSRDNQHYTDVSDKVEKLNDYAQQRYADLQQSIYKNGGRNYLSILSHLPMQIQLLKRDFTDKYMPLDGKQNYSEWRGPVVLGVSVFMLVYIVLAILFSYFLLWGIPWIVKRLSKRTAARFQRLRRRIIDKREFLLKRRMLTVVVGIAIFAVIIMFLKQFFYHNLFIMAAGLMVTLAWLMEAIMVSLLIRLKGDRIGDGVRLYTPFIVMAFIVILFRIVLIPNSLVNLIFPALSLVFVIWQIICQRKYRDKLPLSDSMYSGVSLAAMIVACVLSWLGYTLAAVQIMIWWTFQLAAIQTITCLYDLTEKYEDRFILDRVFGEKREQVSDKKLIKRLRNGEYFTKTWLFDFSRMALIPVVAVVSVLLCIYFAAEIFEMTSVVWKVFFYNFVDQPGKVQISLFKLCLVVAFFFIFRYINYAVRSYYHHWYRKAKKSDSNFNEALAHNVIAIIVWGSYFLFALILLQVPKSGISLVLAGLSTGLGFAMKDLLENFFYGLSLMTGRVRVGDYIECDGVQGKVDSITYQSTQVQTLDGSVIAFLNSSLFSKNFKNLTRNHGFVLVKIPFGVAYGSNIEDVRKMVVEAVAAIDWGKDGRVYDPDRGLQVAFSDFGASSVDLYLQAWVLFNKKYTYLAKARECIYNILNQNNVEIPFPQQDVYIRKVVEPEHAQPAPSPQPAAGGE